jgi:hypothetical protein
MNPSSSTVSRTGFGDDNYSNQREEHIVKSSYYCLACNEELYITYQRYQFLRK